MRQWFYTFIYCVCFCVAIVLSPFSSKLRRGLWDRRGLVKRIRHHCHGWKKPLWFHVASSGELEQCLPILEAIRTKAPQQKIFLSVFSPSGLKGIERETERRMKSGSKIPWDYADYCPLDLAVFLYPFFRALDPEKLICIQREIWPNLLVTAKARGIGCYLFGSYFSPQGRRVFPLYKPWIRHFDFIGTVDDDTTAFLVLELQSDHVQTLGDPRIERVCNRKEMVGAIPPWKSFFTSQQVLVAGSLWQRDLRALLPSLQYLQKESWRLVLVPHELSEQHAMERILKRSGIKTRRWSHWRFEPDDHSHLLVDEIGLLAELYQVAALSFVGGSFRKRVHNVLEPAAYHVPILTGPWIHNSAEALRLRHLGALRSSETSEALLTDIKRLVSDPLVRAEQQESLSSFFRLREPIALQYAIVATES